jgi:Protein of unknown function (DUF2795)
MSEQISGTHSPAEDDAIKRQDREELQAHGDKYPDAEDGDTDATWAEEGRFAGTPEEDWRTIDARSDLARHLDRTAYPATRDQLLATLTDQGADQSLLDLVSTLPDQARPASLGELLRALGLPVEQRPT